MSTFLAQKNSAPYLWNKNFNAKYLILRYICFRIYHDFYHLNYSKPANSMTVKIQ